MSLTPARIVAPDRPTWRERVREIDAGPSPARWRLRAAAFSGAIAINLLILSLVLITARREPAAIETEPRAIDVILVEARPEAESEPEPEADPQPGPEAEPEPVTEAAPEGPAGQAAQGPASIETAPPEPAPQEEDRITGGGAPVFIVPPVSNDTANVLGAIRCASSNRANRDLAPCPDNGAADGLPLQRILEGPPDTLAAFTSPISAAEIRALFGDVPHQLSGQSTLADTTTASASYSSADSMRDQLPPMHPDPAFGN